MNIPTDLPRLKGFRYPHEIIVSWETVRLWVHRFGQHFAQIIRQNRPRTNDKWHMDDGVARQDIAEQKPRGS